MLLRKHEACDVAVVLLLMPRNVPVEGDVVDNGDTWENDSAMAKAPNRVGRGKSMAAETQQSEGEMAYITAGSDDVGAPSLKNSAGISRKFTRRSGFETDSRAQLQFLPSRACELLCLAS